MSERKYSDMHTGDLLMMAIEVNSEVQARLNQVMYCLAILEADSVALGKEGILSMLSVLSAQLKGKANEPK